MGIRNALRLIESGEQLKQTQTPYNGIVSPWAGGQLSQVVWSDIFGVEANTISRKEAMTIPAVAKARQILVSTIAKYPLVALEGNENVTTQHAWLQDTDSEVSPWHRMAWTIDDLMFFGWSLWGVERDADGQILRADRCPIERWQIDVDGVIRIDDQIAEALRVR